MFMLVLLSFSTSEGFAQDEANDELSDGYVIISSRDTLWGVHSCFESCQADSDCREMQRCVAVSNVGQVCMALRQEDNPPLDLTTCEPNVCPATEICARPPGPRLIQSFVDHKRARGFTVYLIDETVWGGGEGDDAADNIRIWLQDNYLSLNLRYALLIGDPRPSGDVPMRGTRPANNAHQYWADNPVVFTDFYFAELDGEWDLDGDGNLAEFGVLADQIQMGSPASFHINDLADDQGQGGVNRNAEIAVGRIPFYGDVDDLDHILQKTMDYENTPLEDTLWRQSALLAAEGERRAFFGELIRTEIMEPQGFSTYRVYDVEDCWDHSTQQDINCLSPIDGEPESLICNPNQVELGINEHRPGFVTWLTHGSGRGAQSVMLQSTARSLPDDYPFFTFQASCYNSQPALPDNLAYELLKNGAIGTVGAATISHGPGSPMPSLINDAGNAGMAYNYALRLFNEGLSAGEALNDLKRDVGLQNRWWYWKNYLTFNLWGDPSVGIYSYAEVDIDPSDMGMPDMQMPDMQMPDMQVPDMQVPDMQMPDMQVPDMQVPDMQMPDMQMPDMQVSDMQIDDDMVRPDDLNPEDNDLNLGDAEETDMGVLADSTVQTSDQMTGSFDSEASYDSDKDRLSSSGCQSSSHIFSFYHLLFILFSLLFKKDYIIKS